MIGMSAFVRGDQYCLYLLQKLQSIYHSRRDRGVDALLQQHCKHELLEQLAKWMVVKHKCVKESLDIFMHFLLNNSTEGLVIAE